MKNQTNCSVSYAEDFRQSRADPDIVPQDTSPLISSGGCTVPGHAIEASVVHRHSDSAAFPCVGIRLECGRGLHFMFTPIGARDFAAALLACADEAEAELANAAQTAMASIMGKGGAK